MNSKLSNLSLRQDEIDWLLRVVRIAKPETENRSVERYLMIFATNSDED